MTSNGKVAIGKKKGRDNLKKSILNEAIDQLETG